MGFFGMQKAAPPVSVASIPQEEEMDDIPIPPRAGSTVIAQGITVTGTLRGEGVVQVEGVVEGEFRMTGAVIVSETGLVRGPITADVVRVAGKVEGDVTAREHMRLEQTGALIGDVATASLVVEDGGCLNGRSTMTKAPDPEPELQDVHPVDDLQFGPDYSMEGEA